MAGDEKKSSASGKLDRVVAEARKNYDERQRGYRAQALKLYPWICGRCTREFTRTNLHELTVHHRDHNHDNNPSDGTNWELLCIYCHENEHARYLDAVPATKPARADAAGTADSHQPFADLKNLFNKKDR